MNQHQWGFAPRIGIAWTPTPKLTVRAGYGIYYDRGELFSYFLAERRFRLQRSIWRDPGAALRRADCRAKGASLSDALRHDRARRRLRPAPRHFLSTLPNLTADLRPGHFPAGNLFGPFLFGGYDINNKLPYTQNWTFDLQYQASNNWLFSVGYVGNHGVHEVLPIPFNQPSSPRRRTR